MNRREVIQSLGLVSSHALLPSILSGFVTSCAQSEREPYSPIFFNQDEFELVRELIDIILPASRSKSASQSNTHHFLDEVFAKCLTSEQQSIIKTGISSLIPEWDSKSNKEQLLGDIDNRAFGDDEDFAYFKLIKQYALVGFYTSQEGTTKASNYVKVPGDYQGEYPISKNTLNYANTNLRFYL